MCFSASVSYGAAAVLMPTGLYAVHRARRLRPPYWVMALVPILFGIQQGFEGRVWQVVEAGNPAGAVPLALAYHFFSHFLWLWWIPLCSYLVEERKRRRRLFLGVGVFGFLAGGLVYFALLFNPGWLSVEVEEHAIVYNVSSTYRAPFELDIPIPASALYGLIILVPLLFSSHRHIRTFGVLVALSIALASAAYGYAFVSVWCFFAAVISLYFVFMIRRLSAIAPHFPG
jgi:hypothetical protein